jgi:hypothetical protein
MFSLDSIYNCIIQSEFANVFFKEGFSQMCRIESHQLLTGDFKFGFEAKVFKRYFFSLSPEGIGSHRFHFIQNLPFDKLAVESAKFEPDKNHFVIGEFKLQMFLMYWQNNYNCIRMYRQRLLDGLDYSNQIAIDFRYKKASISSK